MLRTIETLKKPFSRKSQFAEISELTEKESVIEPRASLSCNTAESARRDLLFQHMNVDDLVGKQTTMVRVVTIYPSERWIFVRQSTSRLKIWSGTLHKKNGKK